MLADYLKSLEKYFYRNLLEFWELPKTSNIGRTYDHMVTVYALKRVFAKLSRGQAEIIKYIYHAADEVLFSEIEQLHYNSGEELRDLLDELVFCGFLYRKKNSIKLNNSHDKYFLYPEIKNNLNFLDRLDDPRRLFKPPASAPPPVLSGLSDDESNILRVLWSHGGICPAYDLEDLSGGLLCFGRLMSGLAEKKIVHESHHMHGGYSNYFILDDAVYHALRGHFKRAPEKILKPEGLVNIAALVHVLYFFSRRDVWVTRKGGVSLKTLHMLEKSMPCFEKRHPFEQLSRKNKLQFIMDLLCQHSLPCLMSKDGCMVLTGRGNAFLEKPFTEIRQTLLQEAIARHHERVQDRQVLSVCRTYLERLKKMKPAWRSIETLLADALRDEMQRSASWREVTALKKESSQTLMSLIAVMLFFGQLELAQNGHHLFVRKTGGEDRTQQKGCLIVNANFEIIAFPDQLDPMTEAHLYGFCDFVMVDSVMHFKITRESIYRARCLGRDFDAFRRTLDITTGGKVPQNVSFNIREWLESIVDFQVKSVYLIQTENPDAIDMLLASSISDQWQPRKINNTTLTVTELDKKALLRFAQENRINLVFDRGGESGEPHTD